MALWSRGFDELIISWGNENLKKNIKIVETICIIEFFMRFYENHTVKTLQITLVLIWTKLKSMLEFFNNAS